MTTHSSISVLGVSGSLRKASYNTALLRAAAELMPPGMTLEIFDLAPLPLFNQDVEKPFPEAVVELRTRLAQADALLIATPEYNNSISGTSRTPSIGRLARRSNHWPASRWPSWAPARGTSAR